MTDGDGHGPAVLLATGQSATRSSRPRWSERPTCRCARTPSGDGTTGQGTCRVPGRPATAGRTLASSRRAALTWNGETLPVARGGRSGRASRSRRCWRGVAGMVGGAGADDTARREGDLGGWPRGCSSCLQAPINPSGGQAMPAFGELTWNEAMERGHAALIESERLYDDINASEGHSNLDIEKHLRRSEVKAAQAQAWLALAGSSATKANGTATQEPERGSWPGPARHPLASACPPASKPEAVIGRSCRSRPRGRCRRGGSSPGLHQHARSLPASSCRAASTSSGWSAR